MPPRRGKRKHDPDLAPDQKSDNDIDLSKSVLVGVGGGGRRKGGSMDDTQEGIISARLPFGDKYIITQHYNPPTDGSEDNPPAFIFTHGAGGGISNPATADFAKGFSTVHPLLCFQGTMNLQNRVKCFKAVLDEYSSSTAVGGRSMGARAAVLAATSHADRVSAVVLVSFPMTSERGGNSRQDILMELPDHVDVLFVTGDNDRMCDLGNLERVRRRMKARSWSVVVEGGDHSMSLKDKSGVDTMRERTGSIAAEWLRERPQGRDTIAKWLPETGEVDVVAWRGSMGTAGHAGLAADKTHEDAEADKAQSGKRRKR